VEYVSPFRCNYTEEILYNMGIALYFLERYQESFEYLQQAAHTFKFNANVNFLFYCPRSGTCSDCAA
jgi:hypothetical protein